MGPFEEFYLDCVFQNLFILSNTLLLGSFYFGGNGGGDTEGSTLEQGRGVGAREVGGVELRTKMSDGAAW